METDETVEPCAAAASAEDGARGLAASSVGSSQAAAGLRMQALRERVSDKESDAEVAIF